MPKTLTSARPPLRLTLPRLSVNAFAALANLVRSRHQLRQLDDRMLKDIGVSRFEAETESSRSIWDVPGSWRL